MTKAGLLRAILSRPGLVPMVGAHDALSAKLIEAAGARPFHEADDPERAAFTDLLQALVERGEHVACVDVYKGWLEVDTFEDYQRAWAEIKS
jgi:NDP-sugar pyrophosphorylase family protein